MRLWHKDLILVLPDMQLRGQWRECCLIAKELHDGTLNHLLVNRVKEYPLEHFLRYGELIQLEMQKRGYKADLGKFVPYLEDTSCNFFNVITHGELFNGWHNDRYLRQCLYNLQEKHDCGGIPDSKWARIADKFPQID